MKPVKKYKISRRFKTPLFEKTQTKKFAFREQRKNDNRPRRFTRKSDYGKQLDEKQKLRYVYSISETVLKKYVKKAVSTKGIPSDKALGNLLERRLDTVVYRLGLALTRRMARQLTSHGHFTINGKKIRVPSYQVKSTDEVGIREGSKRTKLFRDMLSTDSIKPNISWVHWDSSRQIGTITGEPEMSDSVFFLPVVLEYFSR